MKSNARFLMCPPDFYEVDYVINPWMEGNIHKSSPAAAASQWQALSALLEKHATVERIVPQKGLPDMVFTANAGLVVGDRFVLSSFLHRERRGEEAHFKKWFKKQGFEVFELPRDLPFEGAGDALMDRGAVGENNRGLVEVRGQAAPAVAKVVSDVNADRSAV